ncbi:hypothetical protein CLV90_0825 [Maribacter spongiicola]|uniref:Uncharacterized protein n=1 Tax=Maribacter spongiicola TaxID=1206753 RepID=A0A4R7K684_9FLAO|nr:hypothetical protein CLV90_0825 [Maribacter spongiicola]
MFQYMKSIELTVFSNALLANNTKLEVNLPLINISKSSGKNLQSFYEKKTS